MIFRASVVILALFVTDAAWAQSIPVPSTWKNEKNSILEIKAIDKDGKLSGQFTNHAQDTGCQNTPEDIDGVALGDTITFATTFGKGCQTVTVWSGKISGSTFSTTYVLSYFIRDIDKDKKTVEGGLISQSGTDTFTKQ